MDQIDRNSWNQMIIIKSYLKLCNCAEIISSS